MSDELLTATGVRQAVSVVLPLVLEAEPDWPRGPLPFGPEGAPWDAERRGGYFAPGPARALYGGRWHRSVSVTEGPLTLVGLEVLRVATPKEPRRALGVLHFDVRGPGLLAVLRAIGRRPRALPDPLTGALDPAVLFAGVADTAPPRAPFALARPYTVAFLTPGERHTAVLRAEGRLPAAADGWLHALAARATERDNPPTPERLERVAAEAVRISADWSALVGRHGAAFLGHRSDSGDGDFYAFALELARTVHLDALLFGMVQRDHLDALGDELSTLFADSTGLARRVSALERHITVFRSTYWRRHQTVHGPADGLLRAFQTQHRLPELFADVLAEAADYGRIVQTRDNQQIAGALGVLTILGLPLGTALSVLQVLGDDDVGHLLIALGAACAATAAALTTRYGRLVLASLRSGPRP
ncbi:hypothetical protein [Streptomyces sp. B93]|uniref:hypothetical protein n=1 Tax=Streptomyces sp. B93 TaxID=2824875 RepID=UPI001B36CB33|nr:hypothetical protein [Streptomyces sp. B93]MBQ1088973.1 hypothetical protein [Streptomyces sp. B93]